jgi:hypothetical protein
MSDFRALCAELLQPLAEYDGANPYHEHRELITRARAALAEPVVGPAAPSNRESPSAGELQTMAKMFGLEVNDWAALSWLVVTCIAAYGDDTSPTPIPVAERLPGEGDCFFNPGAKIGSCWCFNPVQHLGGIPFWSFEPIEWAEAATHWLPFHALPLPAAPGEGAL